MQISFNQNLVSFKGATININAISDTHGHIELADNAYQSLMYHDAFEKEEKGKTNYLIVAGDWFMSGDKKGYLSNPNETNASFQNKILNFLIRKIKGDFPNTKTLIIPGNHDFDSDKKTFIDTVNASDAQYIISNLDYNNPNGIEKLADEGKIIESQIDFVEDDKDASKYHAILNLGIIPINLKYYQKHFDDINLIDNVKIPQKFVESENYEKTKQSVMEKITVFKEKYPTGTVILTCHTGCGFADSCAMEGNIDLIFNAHEHKDNIRFVNNIPIVELGQNFQKIANVKITKDDEGKTESTRLECFNPAREKYQAGTIDKFLKKLLKKDFKKRFSINSTNETIKELNCQDIRSGNNYLANVVVDVILDSIKEVDDSVQIFALNASSIRSGFSINKGKNVCNYELLNCLSGLQKDEAEIFVNEVTGEELCKMVLQNYLFSAMDTEKNPIIHYAGLATNKTKILESYKQGAKAADLHEYIRLLETGEAIDLNKKYKIANINKYFYKSKYPNATTLFKEAYPINMNAVDAFGDYFKRHKSYTFYPEIRIN